MDVGEVSYEFSDFNIQSIDDIEIDINNKINIAKFIEKEHPEMSSSEIIDRLEEYFKNYPKEDGFDIDECKLIKFLYNYLNKQVSMDDIGNYIFDTYYKYNHKNETINELETNISNHVNVFYQGNINAKAVGDTTIRLIFNEAGTNINGVIKIIKDDKGKYDTFKEELDISDYIKRYKEEFYKAYTSIPKERLENLNKWLVKADLLGVNIDSMLFKVKDEKITMMRFNTEDEILESSIPPVDILGPRILNNNTNIKTVVLPDTVYKIDNGVFCSNLNLESVDFGNSIESIGFKAFADCEKLSNLVFPNTLKIIGDKAFFNCKGLEEVTLSENLEVLGIQAFEHCSKLTHIELPNGLKSIGGGCFYGCTKLADIKLSENLEYISGTAFSKTLWLKEYLKKHNYFQYKNILVRGPNNKNPFELPSTVNVISDGAFRDNRSITRVMIHRGIKEIPYDCFRSCHKLDSIIIPDTVQSIGKNAFQMCKSLEKINIPEGIKEIKEYTFEGCESLREIKLPSTLEHIEKSAFSNCGLTGNLRLPPSLKTLEYNAVLGCENLKTIEIPKCCKINLTSMMMSNKSNEYSMYSNYEDTLPVYVNKQLKPGIYGYGEIEEIALGSFSMPASLIWYDI